MATSRICKVEDCGKPYHANGFCGAHAHRFRRYGDPLGGSTPRGARERFYHEVVLTDERGPEDECLTWPFSTDGHGYPRIENDSIPRLICEVVHGPAPTPKHDAAHSCGRGHLACVTKGHLSWKTRAENEADKLIHGTHNRGSRHGMAKLTEPEVIEIRSLRGHIPQREIAERFGIQQSTVSGILHRKAWVWL